MLVVLHIAVCSQHFFSFRSNRSFLVGGKKEELVLLRATDIAVRGGNSHLTALQASSLSSTVAMFKAGATKAGATKAGANAKRAGGEAQTKTAR